MIAEMVTAAVSSWGSVLPAWSLVSLLALIPVTEYQAALPVVITVFDLSAVMAYASSMLGSVVLFFPLYFGLDKLRQLTVQYAPALVRPIDLFLERAERKMKNHFDLYGAVALFFALVVPFPLTGIWTATAAAVVLKIDFWPAFWGVVGGAAVGSLVVTLATVGVINLV